MMLKLTVNGAPCELEDVDPNTTLLDLLRARGLTGTKEGCGEGECGACTVALVRADGEGARYVPVHACLTLAASVAGQEVLTAEGIAGKNALHPVQAALVEHGASQCGYCTPGFVMSAFAEHHRRGRGAFDVAAVEGNLCRCTGYRPIRAALAALPAPGADEGFTKRLDAPAPAVEAVSLTHRTRAFHRPRSLDALFTLYEKHPDAKLVAGGTDVVVAMNQAHARHELLIALEAIPELQAFHESEDEIVIGAALPIAEVAARLSGRVRMLDSLFPLFGSVLVRNRATLGGNLVTASPIGDGAPALLALDAVLTLESAQGTRSLPLSSFFVGYRRCALEPGELVRAIRIPKPLATHTRFDKIAKRVSDDISSVAGACAVTLAADGTVETARFAFGGVADTPIRVNDVERLLIGQAPSVRVFNDVRAALRNRLRPIDDVRASASYRMRAADAVLARFARDLGVEVDALSQVTP